MITDRQARFLDTLRTCDMSLTEAARRVGVSAGNVNGWRQNNPAFWAACEEALVVGRCAAQRTFLDALTAGASVRDAAAAAGVPLSRAVAWRLKDLGFAMAVDRCRETGRACGDGRRGA